MLGLFGLNKVTLYVIGALLLTGAIATTYYVWKRDIEHTAVLEFNKQQLEQNVRDQAEFIRRQEEVVEQQRRASAELVENSRRLQIRVNSINQMINQAQDGPVPDVIRQTIERLKEESSR
jgi:hypothetical protein